MVIAKDPVASPPLPSLTVKTKESLPVPVASKVILELLTSV